MEQTLAAIGIDVHTDPRLIEVLNKIDLLPQDERPAAALHQANPAIGVSALTGEGVAQLKARIEQQLSAQQDVFHFTLRPEQGEEIAWLFAHAHVLQQQHDDESIKLQVRMNPADVNRFKLKFSILIEEPSS